MVSRTFVLDTDLFSLFQRGTGLLVRRIAGAEPGSLFLSVITVEESLTGWYTLVRQTNRADQLEYAYGELAKAVVELARFPILNYTQDAMAQFERLQKLRLGVKKKDLRIAAIALSNNATVVTRNLADFRRVPGLAVEDWSAP